jgi:hypothetical protein
MLVMDDVARAPRVAALAAERSSLLVGMLGELGVDQLLGPSDLVGWTRLTIVCHLRYGASALLRMTRDALAGRTTSYYPRGRSQQRPSTLEPQPAESATHVVASLGELSAELNATWAQLSSKE